TDFAVEEYGNSPFPYVERLGFSRPEWDRVEKVTVLRACVLSPFINDLGTFEEYMEKVDTAIQKKLERIYSKMK
ncbi:MAG: tyrosine decarboxylase, partial [Clostridium sp.]